MIEIKYNGLVDRKIKVDEKESEGLRMISDTFDPDWKQGEEPRGTMVFTDEIIPDPPVEPPYSTHIGQITDIDPSKVKPATIKRMWEGQEFTYNCLVTQDIRDQYAEGKINIGDYVLVHFFDDDMEKPISIVMQKVFKTW